MIMWYANIGNTIYSYVKYVMENQKGWSQKKLYCTPDLGLTAVDEDGTPKNFPTLYIHELPSVEKGNDLTNETVNAVLSSVEIKGYTKEKNDGLELISDAAECMKALKFNITGIPLVEQTGDYYTSVARFRRMVGSGDKDLVS